MANARLSLHILGLGILFFALSFFIHGYVMRGVTLPFYTAFLLALAIAAPFFASLFLIERAEKKLAEDEYQQQLLRGRTYYAFIAAVGYTLLKGVVDSYGGEANVTPQYVWPIFYWYMTWLLAGLFKPEAT